MDKKKSEESDSDERTPIVHGLPLLVQPEQGEVVSVYVSNDSLEKCTKATGMSNASTVLCPNVDGPHPQPFSCLRAGEGRTIFGETRAPSSPHPWRGGREVRTGTTLPKCCSTKE